MIDVITRRDVVRSATVAHDDLLQAEVGRRLAVLDDADRWSVSVRGGVARVVDHRDRPADLGLAVHLAESVPGVAAASASCAPSDPM